MHSLGDAFIVYTETEVANLPNKKLNTLGATKRRYTGYWQYCHSHKKFLVTHFKWLALMQLPPDQQVLSMDN